MEYDGLFAVSDDSTAMDAAHKDRAICGGRANLLPDKAKV
jgi:hypothetical protein